MDQATEKAWVERVKAALQANKVVWYSVEWLCGGVRARLCLSALPDNLLGDLTTSSGMVVVEQPATSGVLLFFTPASGTAA